MILRHYFPQDKHCRDYFQTGISTKLGTSPEVCKPFLEILCEQISWLPYSTSSLTRRFVRIVHLPIGTSLSKTVPILAGKQENQNEFLGSSVVKYRKRLLELQGTEHDLERNCPGY